MRAESRKWQRYQEQCSLVGVKLVPFIVTTYSSLGPEALKLVRWVGKLLEGSVGKADSTFLLQQSRQFLSVSVMRQVARQLTRGVSFAGE